MVHRSWRFRATRLHNPYVRLDIARRKEEEQFGLGNQEEEYVDSA
jgi:hypothetical protein